MAGIFRGGRHADFFTLAQLHPGARVIRALTAAVVALAVLWSGWWFVAAQVAGQALDGFAADLRGEGWSVEYGDLATRGFPSRIDTIAEDITMIPPGGGGVWEIPRLQAMALTYRPNEIILSWPQEQIITLPDQRLVLWTDRLESVARLGISTELPLREVIVQSGLVTLVSDAGWRVGASNLLAKLHETPADRALPDWPASYDLFAQLQEVALPAGTGGVGRPDASGDLHIDATIGLDRPIAPGQGARIEAITLREARAEWGMALIALSGQVVADEAGIAQGTVELELRNWPMLMTALVETGLMPPEAAGQLRAILSFASSGDDSLRAPLVLSGGVVLLGGLLPLGPAPRLR